MKTTQSPEREGKAKFKVGDPVFLIHDGNRFATIIKRVWLNPESSRFNYSVKDGSSVITPVDEGHLMRRDVEICKNPQCYIDNEEHTIDNPFCSQSDLQPLAEEKPAANPKHDCKSVRNKIWHNQGDGSQYNQCAICDYVYDYIPPSSQSKDTAPEEWDVHKPIIDIMRTNGFRLMKDSKTFYQEGYELNPRMGICFDMHQAYQIANMLKARDERAVKEERERVVEIVKKCYLRRPRITGNCLGLGGIDDMSDSAIKDHNKVVDYVLKAIRKTESVPDHEGEGRGE